MKTNFFTKAKCLNKCWDCSVGGSEECLKNIVALIFFSNFSE